MQFFRFIRNLRDLLAIQISPAYASDSDLSALHAKNTYTTICLPVYWFLSQPRILTFYPEINPRTDIQFSSS